MFVTFAWTMAVDFDATTINALDYLIVGLSFVSAAVLLALGSVTARRAFAADNPQQRRYLAGICAFLTTYAVARLFFIFQDLVVQPMKWKFPMNHDFGLSVEEEALRSLLWTTGSAIGLAGLATFFFATEGSILEPYLARVKFRHPFSLAVSVVLALVLAFNAPGVATVDARRVTVYASVLPAVVVPVVYFLLSLKTSGVLRRNATLCGWGMTLLFLGIAIDSTAGQLFFESVAGLAGPALAKLLGHALMISGPLLFYVGTLAKV
ncbi:MAG: hypothetical protein Kow0069_25620 [Promethearchaeota archaeon]